MPALRERPPFLGTVVSRDVTTAATSSACWTGRGLNRLDLERRRDVDGRHQGPCNRAVLCVGTQNTFGRRAFVRVLELQVVGHVDALEDQDLVLFLDLALGDSDEPVTA